MKNILLLVHDDPGQEARFQAALDIARAVGGHVHCLDVTPLPRTFDTPFDGVGAALVLQAERESESRSKAQLQQRLSHEDVPWSWSDAIGEFDRALEQASALADLIVVNRALDTSPYPDMRDAAGELIMRTRRPVLAVPETARRFDALGHALVAWDGSAPASAAMIAAIPLLVHAAGVTLIEIGAHAEGTKAEDAAVSLGSHGIKARIVREPDEGRAVDEALLAAVAAHNPGYMVMGGYGHRRIGESLWGGVTRAMLKDSPVPLLLAH